MSGVWLIDPKEGMPDRQRERDQIQHYLGHKNITHTVRYTELAPDRFKGFLAGLIECPLCVLKPTLNLPQSASYECQQPAIRSHC